MPQPPTISPRIIDALVHKHGTTAALVTSVFAILAPRHSDPYGATDEALAVADADATDPAIVAMAMNLEESRKGSARADRRVHLPIGVRWAVHLFMGVIPGTSSLLEFLR